jgi:hypothetical protein
VREEPRKATPETGTCLVCGQVFPTQEELSKHLITILLNQGQVHHSCAVETGLRGTKTTIHYEATAWYSRMSPPMRSRRPISGTSSTGTMGDGFSGTASLSPRWGRCAL